MSISGNQAKGKIMQNYLIICAGSTIMEYRKRIQSYINRIHPIVIGINNVAHLFKLDYHMWTNYRRFRSFYSGDSTKLIFSNSLYEKILEKKLYGFGSTYAADDIILIHDEIERWRTAGIRAIQYANDNNHGTIDVVGMDGYSLKYNGNQHCYGVGSTDTDNKEYCKTKDKVMCANMLRMKKEGVKFRILTPTVFKKFYCDNIL